MKISKIISGGQTGADRGGLEAGKLLKIPTGGYAPRNYLTEKGPDLSLKEFGLEDSGKNYVGRTEMNVEYSDTTLWFGRGDSPGYYATLRECKKHNRLFIDVTNKTEDEIRYLISHASILNVAGNRESKSPGIQENVKNILIAVLKEHNE